MTKKKDETPASVKAIKGMNNDMMCRGFQFEVGKTYTVEGDVKACANGFHACPVDDETPPHAVFEYYGPGQSRYFEATASGKTDREGNKIASASITIGVELTMGELMRRVAARCVDKANGAASNSGDYGAALSHSIDGKVMCEGDEQALYCSEIDGNFPCTLKSNACGVTGRDGIKAGVWYHCRDGKLVPVS